MNEDSLSSAGAVFASNYIKRWLEKYYDELMSWPMFQKIKGLGPTVKYVIEAGLFALTGYATTKLDSGNPLTATLIEVFKDAAPEITSRLMADVRGGLSAERLLDASPYQSVAGKMLSLDDASLLSLLAWLENADETSRAAFVAFAESHEAQELTRFAGLAAGQRETLLGAIAGTKSSGWQAAKEFLKDFGRIVAAGGKKGVDVSVDVMKRYAGGLVWLLKLCAILWALGVLCWQASALSAGQWSMFTIMLGLTAGCGGMIWWGQKRQTGWLKWAGIIGVTIMATLTLLTATGHEEVVPGLSFMFLLGFPSVAMIVALLPLNAILALLKGLMPDAYATLTRVVQMVVVAFMGIVVFSVFLFLVPARGNPVAIFVLAPLAIVLTLAVGIRLVNVDPDRFFGWPLKASLVFILLVCFGTLFVPTIKEHFVEDPVPVVYQSGKDIPFSDKSGHSMIWYAEIHNGGFELFTAKAGGLYTPDGRKLRPADTETVRQQIRNWIDQESARAAILRSSRSAAEQENTRQQAQEAQRDRESALFETVDAPVPVKFPTGKDIPFADKHGHSMISYAETPNGGFELFTARAPGLYTPDGRQLKLADSGTVRQQIRNWVDQENARVATQSAAKIAAEEEAARQLEQKALRNLETARIGAEKARRVSYIDTLPTNRVNYAICAAHEDGVLIPALSSRLVKELRAKGKTASDIVLSQEFAKEALRPFMAGKGREDLEAMELSKCTDRLLLISVNNERLTDSQRFVNLRTASATMIVVGIDPTDGRKVQEYVINDVSGAGVNETTALAAFYERFAAALITREL